jgi:hypothetical protein
VIPDQEKSVPVRGVARRGLVLLAVAGLLAPALAAAEPTARSAAKRTVVLGESRPVPRPSCPRSCEAVGRVTGYQVLANGSRYLHRAPADGKIVAWSITLSRPRASQVTFFNDFYGSPPSARLSVLRTGKRNSFTLTGQGPTENLSRYLGETPVFALDQPLTIRKGYFVAITIPTWAPSFATGLSTDNAWRASRPRGKCRQVKRQDAHQQRQSARTYGCLYKTARLIYTATMVVPGT